MDKITVNFDHETGAIKPMHATNNITLRRTAFSGSPEARELWREAGIPYCRNHDAAFFSNYGGDRTVDVTNIFRDFDKDPYDENSYDFIITDHYVKLTIEAGSKVFYRLGQKIDHRIKPYDSQPPKDFHKWAVICEHIIRHYTEGWADGFHYDIKYWEIWNEPDLDAEDAEKQRTWSGTDEQFFELYTVAATHLKKCFPHLKIGGPAAAYRKPWFLKFLTYITRNGNRVPLDFFSYHCYGYLPEKMFDRSREVRAQLDAFGYNETESILNEWNYVKSWNDLAGSAKTRISLKGAAFTAACMCGAQSTTDIDMLMYYDARPCIYNGLFDYYTNAALKGYYPFRMFNTLYALSIACECIAEGDHLYAAAAKNQDGDTAIMITYYDDSENALPKTVALNTLSGAEKYQLLLLDQDNDATPQGSLNCNETLTIQPNTVCLLTSDMQKTKVKI